MKGESRFRSIIKPFMLDFIPFSFRTYIIRTRNIVLNGCKINIFFSPHSSIFLSKISGLDDCYKNKLVVSVNNGDDDDHSR